MIKQSLKAIIPLLGWFAVVAQFILLMQNSNQSTAESIIRFFSFFTILTNILVAGYFTMLFFMPDEKSDGTSITVYIFIVGLIYQIILRALWSPSGLQKIVDELLHTVLPIAVLCYWYFFQTRLPKLKSISYWILYPLLYLVFVLVRGSLSGFYPYPFIDLSTLPAGKVLINCIAIALLFVMMSFAFVFLKNRKPAFQP